MNGTVHNYSSAFSSGYRGESYSKAFLKRLIRRGYLKGVRAAGISSQLLTQDYRERFITRLGEDAEAVKVFSDTANYLLLAKGKKLSSL